MLRRKPAWPEGTSYSHLNVRLERTAVRLVALLVADKQLKYFFKKYDLPFLMEASVETEDWELIHLTVELATGYRLIHWNAKHKIKTLSVGSVWSSTDSEKIEPLSMLEACNKVIHATKLEFFSKKVRGFPLTYVEPYLSLDGKKGAKEWSATIDMLMFCNEALAPHSNWLPPSKPSSA